MIRFMVLAAPRSGTAWVANWLTNGANHCIHDPLFDHHYGDLDRLEYPGKTLGIACTGMGLFADWVNQHPAPKVILHRDRAEVNEACRKLGFPPCPGEIFRGLARIRGLHVEWQSLFAPAHAREIHQHLLLDPFDRVRHEMLCRLNVTRDLKQLRQNPDVIAKLRAEGIPVTDNAAPHTRSLESPADLADARGHQKPD